MVRDEAMTYPYSTEELRKFEAEFKDQYGYDWPNCSVPDCQWKSCVPWDTCYVHLTPEQKLQKDHVD